MLFFFVTGRMLQSGKLPALNLLTGRKSTFLPRKGNSLDQFTWNLAQPRGTRGSAWPCKISGQSVPRGGNAAPEWQISILG